MSEVVGGRPAARSRARQPSQRVDDAPAFLLHSYAYRETSLIAEIFSRSHGRVAMVAKGAKRPHSALRSVLATFQPLRLSWSGGGEVKTLVRAEWGGAPQRLIGSAMMSAWYLNELLLRLMARDDAHEAIYDTYIETLARLSSGVGVSAALRSFEWALLREIGYGFDPSVTEGGDPVEADRWYRVQVQGGVEHAHANDAGKSGVVPGTTLVALVEDDFDDVPDEPALRRLLRERLDYHMNGRPLATRRVLHDLQDL
jgi:DNA repair protein RecO (recombination protein O)